MTIVSTASNGGALAFPAHPFTLAGYTAGASSPVNTVTTIDATGEIMAYIGYLVFEDLGAGGSATIDTSASIQFRVGNTTWANSSSEVKIGLQDVDGTNTTAPTRPDGTFDVYASINPTGGTNPVSLTSAAWNTVTFGSGTKTVAHGDVVALVFEMVTRGGTDSVTLTALHGGNPLGAGGGLRSFTSSTWAVVVGMFPHVVFTAADGRKITFYGSVPLDAQATQTFNDSSNPDEYGNVFQVPARVRCRFALGNILLDSLSSDFTLSVYSDPLGTPTTLASVTVDTGQLGHNLQRYSVMAFSSSFVLEAKTDYAIAIKAAGASASHDVVLAYVDVSDTAHFKFVPSGNTCYGVSRNGGSGAFSAVASSKRLFMLAVAVEGLEYGDPEPTMLIGI